MLAQEESSFGHIICELHNKISLMLAQLSFWHFLEVAINDSTAEASCRVWLVGLGVFFKKNKK